MRCHNIAGCDLVIAFVGDEYGTEPSPGEAQQGGGARSYAHWEYHFAQGERLSGHRAVAKEMLVYVLCAPTSGTLRDSRQSAFVAMIRDSGKHRGEPTRFLVVTALSGMGVSLRGQLRNVKQAADAHVEALIPLACSIGGAVGCTLALGAPNEWLLPLLVAAVTFSWLAYVTWPIAMRLLDRLSVMWIKWRYAKSPRNGPALHDLMASARTQSESADMLGGLIAHFAREDAIRSLGRVDYHKNAMPVSATRASSLGRGSEPSGSRPKSPRRASQRARPRRSSSGWCHRCGAPNVEPGRTAPFAGR